jgi:glucose 1-dehydrogenase
MTEKKLANEVAIVTGSDSGIGQATAVAFAREGADVAVTYLEDRKGAEHTVQLIEELTLPMPRRQGILASRGCQ